MRTTEASAVGVKSSSVHYHFPTKGDLAAAIAHQYANEADAGFDEVIESGADVKTCTKLYIKRWRAALEDCNRMCLCAIMAAEYDLLPLAVKKEVDRFTGIHIRWLEKVLTLETKNLTKKGLKKRATAIFAAFQGAQLMARSRADISLYDETVKDYRVAGLVP